MIYDIVVFSDYMIDKMIKENFLVKFDYLKIVNWDVIGVRFKNLSFDFKNKYLIFYFWGIVGIVYND